MFLIRSLICVIRKSSSSINLSSKFICPYEISNADNFDMVFIKFLTPGQFIIARFAICVVWEEDLVWTSFIV